MRKAMSVTAEDKIKEFISSTFKTIDYAIERPAAFVGAWHARSLVILIDTYSDSICFFHPLGKDLHSFWGFYNLMVGRPGPVASLRFPKFDESEDLPVTDPKRYQGAKPKILAYAAFFRQWWDETTGIETAEQYSALVDRWCEENKQKFPKEDDEIPEDDEEEAN